MNIISIFKSIFMYEKDLLNFRLTHIIKKELLI